MKRMIPAALAVILLLPAAATAQATHGFTFTWEDPVARTDGVPLDPETELGSYRLRCVGAENVERIVARSATQATTTTGARTFEWTSAVTTGGWYDCSMSVTDVNALESDMSVIVKVRKLAKPNPPGLRN
jgi:hypothetical protein